MISEPLIYLARKCLNGLQETSVLLQYYMGGGSSETPKLYYVIYEQPLKASGLKMEHLPADHHHHHHHGNHHDLYDPHHNDDGVNARSYNTDQGGQEEQDFTLVFFVKFFIVKNEDEAENYNDQMVEIKTLIRVAEQCVKACWLHGQGRHDIDQHNGL